MHAFASSGVFTFEGFRLDRPSGGLFRDCEDGSLHPVPLGSRALDILALLVDRRGDLVTEEEIFAAVWPETVVEDSNLTVQIAALRRVLDRGRTAGTCIQTVTGRGYRFVVAVMRHSADVRSNATTAPEIGPRPIPRLSIVVLPFANLSNDPEQQYFADAITEDLTIDLSRIPHSFVISRNTAFTYRNKSVDTKQIGRELGVRYVLEGSVRRSGDQLRITAQLIDAETDAHLWAERFDRGLGDLFALQNEITGRIAVALNMELLSAEAARPTSDPDALDYILRARAASLKPSSRARYPEAIRLYERALALDPQSEAQSYLASLLMARVVAAMSDSPAADIGRAETLVEQALAASPRSPLAHYAKAQVLRAQGRYEEAIPEYETALASNRNWVHAINGLGQCKRSTGHLEEVIPLFEHAIRLSPRDPEIGVWYWNIGQVLLLQSRIDEAIVWLEKARNASPEPSYIHASLASAYGLKGETERAAAELAEARRLASDDRYSSLVSLRATRDRRVPPAAQAIAEATYYVGLRKAGIPEE